jgi:SOS response regulatory protein OraA/RecX
MYELAGIDWNRILEPPVVMFIVAAIIAVAAIVAPQWRRSVKASEDARLKEQMIQRGFSADEIERVIRAGADEKRGPAGKFGATRFKCDPDC